METCFMMWTLLLFLLRCSCNNKVLYDPNLFNQQLLSTSNTLIYETLVLLFLKDILSNDTSGILVYFSVSAVVIYMTLRFPHHILAINSL